MFSIKSALRTPVLLGLKHQRSYTSLRLPCVSWDYLTILKTIVTLVELLVARSTPHSCYQKAASYSSSCSQKHQEPDICRQRPASVVEASPKQIRAPESRTVNNAAELRCLPSFRGGDSGKGQGLGKVMQAVKAIDCRWTNMQIKHLLTDKLKELVTAGDTSKLRKHLEAESKKLGLQPKGQVPPDAPTQPPAQPQEQRKGNKGSKGKGGKPSAKGQGKAPQPKEDKTVALPAGTFNVSGVDLPVRSQLVLGAPGVALAQDTSAVLQDYRRLQSSSHTHILVTSAKGKKPAEPSEPVLEGLELLITEAGRTHTALLSAYVWHLAGPKAKVSQAARVIDMGPATTITVKLIPTPYVKQEGRTPPTQYTVKTMRQFFKLIDPQLDVKIQDLWQPSSLAHDDAFVIRTAKENAHQALSRLTRHGFATTPQRSWQQDMGVIWLQDRTYADAARSAAQTLTAIPEENDWRRDSSLFLKQGAQRATYGLRIPTDYMDLGRAAAGLDNTKAHVLTGCSHKWSKQDVEKALQLIHWDAKPQRPMGKYTWLIRATHPPQQDRYLMQCEYERLNLVVKPYVQPGQLKPPQETAEARLMQETSWANVVKGNAKLSVKHQPSKLRVDWGDIEDSDDDEDSDQDRNDDVDQEPDDMDDGPDSRKRTGVEATQQDAEQEQSTRLQSPPSRCHRLPRKRMSASSSTRLLSRTGVLCLGRSTSARPWPTGLNCSSARKDLPPFLDTTTYLLVH
eukprot:5134434-Amphidinium_carterae.1